MRLQTALSAIGFAGAVAGLMWLASPAALAGGCSGGKCNKGAGSACKAKYDGMRSVPAPGSFAKAESCVLTASSCSGDEAASVDLEMLRRHRLMVIRRDL